MGVIAYLRGTARASDVLVTPGGVGYQVLCPRPLTVGDEVELEVVSHTARTETRLYGFSSIAECRLFRSLTALPQVGPSVALALLRDIGAAGVVAAVTKADADALAKAQGVGKKVAERIAAMLRIPELDLDEIDELPPDAEADLIGYLVELGYSQAEAQAAAATTSPTTRVEDRVAAAVRHLHAASDESRPLQRTA